MDGFTYHNIFQTKGIEYLVIIAFLLIIIPFWIVLNRKKQMIQQIQKAVAFTMGVLKIPKGVLYSRNHAWTHLEKSGTAEVGMDDFLLHLTGQVRINSLKNRGEEIKKGEVLTEIEKDGKVLKVLSPISGRILAVNPNLHDDPAAVNRDAYGAGWIYRIEPANWVAETRPYILGEEAVDWFRDELERFKDFMAVSMAKNRGEGSLVVLQEGGELSDQPLSDLPPDVWQDFQNEFLDQQ
jgi:glycine cleavage system H protein